MSAPSDSTEASSKTRSVPRSLSSLLLILIAFVVLGGLGILWATRAGPASQCVGTGPCLLYFYADWWPVCQQMAPIVDGLERKYGSDLHVVRINADRSAGQKLAREYGFIGQPTFIFLDRTGQETRRLTGAHPDGTFEREVQRLLGLPKPW